MIGTDVKSSRNLVLDVTFISGVSVAGVLILLWFPIALFVAMTWTGLEGTIANHNLFTAVGEYPLILALPMAYAIVFHRRRGLLAVLVTIMWCVNVAVVIVLGACLNDVYGTDRDVGDWYELEDDRRLINAIIENDANHVETHVRSGKRVIFFGERGVNPMYVAVHMDRWAIAKTLIDAGHDIRHRPPSGKFSARGALFRSSRHKENESRMQFLRMLLKSGIKPEEQVGGDSMLKMAIRSRDLSALREMMPFTDIRNGGESYALQLVLQAIEHRSWTCGELLLPYLDSRDVLEVITAAEQQKDMLPLDPSQPDPRGIFIAKLRSMR